MDNLPKIQSTTDLQKCEQQSTSRAAVKEATRIAEKILGAYPDYGKAPDGYLLAVTEFIAHLSAEDREALAHPVTGIVSKSEFLPSIAKIKQFVDDRGRRLNTRATGYRYLKPGEEDEIEIPPGERRKAQVLKELGYDPSISREVRQPRRPLDPGIIDAIQEGSWSSSSLKTPSGPITPELRALLIEQGVLHPATSEAA